MIRMSSHDMRAAVELAQTTGMLISDDVARAVAEQVRVPGPNGAGLTQVAAGNSTGVDWVALLVQLDAMVKADHSTDQAHRDALDALREWTWQRVPHVEVTRVVTTGTELAELDGNRPDTAPIVERYAVHEYAEDLGAWHYPGDARYPAPDQVHRYEQDADGLGVFLPADPSHVVAQLLCGHYSQFWANEYVSDGDNARDFRPGGTYYWRDEHPYRDDVTLCEARLIGFDADGERDAWQAWRAY